MTSHSPLSFFTLLLKDRDRVSTQRCYSTDGRILARGIATTGFRALGDKEGGDNLGQR